MNSKNPEIRKSEWDFSKCPKKEAYYAIIYELFREIKKPPGFSSLFEERKTPIERIYLNQGTPLWMASFPEWPKTPWLEIPEKNRKSRIKQISYDFFNSAWRTIQADPSVLFVKDSTHRNVTEEHLTIACLGIDWKLSNKELQARFQSWLSEYRPKKIKNPEERGKAHPKDLLKKLGAFRLKRAYGWAKATKISENLYENQAAWIRAETQAQTAINAFRATRSLNKALSVSKSVKLTKSAKKVF